MFVLEGQAFARAAAEATSLHPVIRHHVREPSAPCAAECAVGHDETRDAILGHGANHRRMQALSGVAVLAVSRLEPPCKSVRTAPAAKCLLRQHVRRTDTKR
jgi:hypothetical protein